MLQQLYDHWNSATANSGPQSNKLRKLRNSLLYNIILSQATGYKN